MESAFGRWRWGFRAVLAVLLASQALVAGAQTRAWLDRDRIALGDTATLNIQTDQALASSPDYSPLLGDFTISSNSSSRQYAMVNGVGQSSVLFAVALRPGRQGLLTIPSLQVGNQHTQPLTLSVTEPVTNPARAGDPVFIDSEADAQDPYVQQAVGFTVRLYYSGAISGQIDQPAPAGTTLQQVGDDVQYTRQLGGTVYSVLERHFLLIPDRSGTLVIPGARFRGQGAGGMFDDLIGGGGGQPLHADAAPRFLHVRAVPADAPQPWLPLRALALRYLATPRAARVGEAATVTVEADADGAIATQLPPLQVSAEGAQVFAEPMQHDDAFTDGRPRVRASRTFSIVPSRAGSLRIHGPTVAWWDARAGLARTAALPDIVLQVAPGAAATPGNPRPASTLPDAGRSGPAWAGIPAALRHVQPWLAIALLFAVGWLAMLLRGARRSVAVPPPAQAPLELPDAPAGSASGQDLRRALATGDLADVASVLCAMARPPAFDVDAVRERLADPDQIAALDALQRARWAGGDGVAARAALRSAFAKGPRWKSAAPTPRDSLLPPLYPDA